MRRMSTMWVTKRHLRGRAFRRAVDECQHGRAQAAERTDGESLRFDRGGSNPQVAGADLGAAGDLSDEVEGRASPKGSSELRTATILVEHLNSHGA